MAQKSFAWAGPLISGPKFGEIRQGWAADIVLLNGEPQLDIRVLKDLEQSVVLVIKGGVIIVNRLTESAKNKQ